MDREREATIIGRIAEMLIGEAEPFSDGALLSADVTFNAVHAGIFRDEGEVVRFIIYENSISDELLRLWDLADEGKKWSSLVMTIEGDSFNVCFDYDEDWNPEVWEPKLERLLAAKYGNKKIVYPSVDELDVAQNRVS